MPQPRRPRGRRRVRKNVPFGQAHIKTSFNNTIVSLTDKDGNVIAWESAGGAGFKGSRKSTPFAAQVTADAAARKGMEHGLQKAGVDPNTYVKDLTEDEVRKIRERVDDLLVEGDLRREQSQNIKRLMEIGAYRGLRHRRGLPVNGQRTKTNARTRKGPKRGSSAAGGRAALRPLAGARVRPPAAARRR